MITGSFQVQVKPSLWKSGSEQILAMFQIAVDPIVEDLSTDDCYRYRVTTRLTNVLTGEFLGSGIGECSTNETKYKWKRTYSKAEFDSTDPDRRRIKYSTYNNENKEEFQVRQEPADLANTILKMAKKRSQIDATLTVTGASSMFEQDLEDLPEDVRQQQQPSRKAAKSSAIPSDVMCSECRAMGGHLPSCKFATPAPPVNTPTPMVFTIQSIMPKKKKDSNDVFLQMNAVGDDKIPFTCNVFDKKYHEYLMNGVGKICTAEMFKNDKGYWNMAKLIEVVGVGVYTEKPTEQPTSEELFER